MRTHIILPAIALAGGAVGFGMRLWQWSAAYAPEQERFLSGHPSAYVLALLLAVLAVCFFLLSRRYAPKNKPLPCTCGDTLYMMCMAAGSLLFMGAGIFGMMEGMRELRFWRMGLGSAAASYPIALLLCGALCAMSCPCVMRMGICAYRPKEDRSASLPAVIPPFALLVWLFATHQAHATDPIFLGYGLYLAAAALLTVAHYDAAGFYQRQRHTFRFLFCTLMGTALAVASFSDGLSPFQMFMAAACVLTALGHAFALLSPATEPEL